MATLDPVDAAIFPSAGQHIDNSTTSPNLDAKATQFFSGSTTFVLYLDDRIISPEF
jgi:hypothetical protein